MPNSCKRLSIVSTISLFLLLILVFPHLKSHHDYFNSNPILTPGRPVPDPGNLNEAKIAVCLVGGARRFELTGPSIVKNLLRQYPNADLFLNSPLDSDSYKFSLLGGAPRIAAVRIGKPEKIRETEDQLGVLTSNGSPNGIQGLLQYFSLVEGCLKLITHHQSRANISYDWVIRTRVDSYWSGTLDRHAFDNISYVVPEGSRYGGLNDRLGIGNPSTTKAALSRLSLIPDLVGKGYQDLNSESAFEAQLVTRNVTYREIRAPFCVMSDRRYGFPPREFGVPVASIGSVGPLSGTKCRPCTAKCVGECVEEAGKRMLRRHGWVEYRDGGLELCDGSEDWEVGWEKIFDRISGVEAAKVRKKVGKMWMGECVREWEVMRSKAFGWEVPRAEVICGLGLKNSKKLGV